MRGEGKKGRLGARARDNTDVIMRGRQEQDAGGRGEGRRSRRRGEGGESIIRSVDEETMMMMFKKVNGNSSGKREEAGQEEGTKEESLARFMQKASGLPLSACACACCRHTQRQQFNLCTAISFSS